jgi:hypothetical protein
VIEGKRIRTPNPKYFDVDSVSIEEGLSDSPELVNAAIIAELTQMEDMGAFHPILRSSISVHPIPSKMIVKKKSIQMATSPKSRRDYVLVGTDKFVTNPSPPHLLLCPKSHW